jgi:hypothetical protein
MVKAHKRMLSYGLCAAVGLVAILQGAIGPAHAAGPCGQELAQFEVTVRQSAANPAVGPTAPESTAAKLRHQPTPESVRRAAESAQGDLDTLLNHAWRLDTIGDQAGCMQALGTAKRMFVRR